VESGKDELPQGNESFLPPDLRDAFLARAHVSKARPRQVVIAEGSTATDVYLIRSGKVRISRFSDSGREIILRDMGPGEIFGEIAAIDHAPRSASVAAIEESVLARLAGEEFLTFLGEVPQAGLWMARQLASRVRDLTEKTSDLATLPVAGRVQRELLRLAHEAGVERDQVALQPMPTHAEIAARIGTHREAVTRELNLLAREGILRQAGRRAEILSVGKLKALYDRIGRS
jgi:CRP/FNR family cyclic AMP-dependent transcriptional regulator